MISRESTVVRLVPAGSVGSAASDVDSCEDLYEKHVDVVSRWVANLAGPGADVEDLTHEVFMIAFRRLASFRGDAKITTWLYRIALNVVRNQRRRARIVRWLSLSSARESELVLDVPAVDEQIDRERRRRLVYAVLDRLPERERVLLVMFEIEHLSGVEIAERLNVRIGTVWVRLHRAREAFARELEACGGLR